MQDKITIYTLKDPITNEIRYIGKVNTKRFNKRYIAHCNPHNKADGNTHKYNWTNKLKREGLKPIMEVLDTTNEDEWGYLEKYWIQQFKAWGFRLLNINEGGENPPICKEWNEKRKLRASKNRKDKRKIRVWNNVVKKKDGRFGEEFIVKKDYVGDFNGINNFIKNHIGLDRYENEKQFNLWSSKISSICNKNYGRKTHKNYTFEYIDI